MYYRDVASQKKRLDILRGDKLLRTSCIKIDTALIIIKEADWETTGGNKKRVSRRSIWCKVGKA